jgi:hypothetical protein
MSALAPTGAFSADTAFVQKVTTGLIAVYVNTTLAPVLDPCNGLLAPSNTGAVVALVSHGKNGFYAKNVSGNTNTGPAGPSDETQNAAPTTDPGVPPYCPWNVFRIVKHDATDTFDDVMMTISESEFTAPLIASGAVQGGPDWALNKANDIVLGNVPGTRTACPGPDYSNTCSGFYYTLPPTGISFPPEVAMFGVAYTRGTTGPASNPVSTTISTIDSATPFPGTDIAYTLTSAGGTSRNVTVGELKGILTRGAGF